jgi:ribosome-binding factor A
MTNRPVRVASLIKEEIGAILVREYGDQTSGFTTVTGVDMSADLRIAKVYVSIFGSPEQQARTMALLETEKGHIRGMVASRIRIRFIPELQFFQDTTLDRVDRINSLIKKIHDDGKNPGTTE